MMVQTTTGSRVRLTVSRIGNTAALGCLRRLL
jgi:hypothetical protein